MPLTKTPWSAAGTANRANAVVNAEDDENRRDAPDDEGDDVDNIARGGSPARVEGNGPTPPSPPSAPRKYRG